MLILTKQIKFLTCLMTFSTLVAFTTSLVLQDVRSNPLPLQKQATVSANTSINCDDGLEFMVESCAAPLMSMIMGTMEKWPQNEKDVGDFCDSFITTEKCIKDVGRKCAKGLHKTIISTIGTAVQRVRKRECSQPKLAGLLKVTKCVEKNQAAVQTTLANVTTGLSLIESQIKDVDKKTNAVCCMVNDIENQIKALYAPRCPKEGEIVVRIYRSVLEEVIELICRSPKCNNYLAGYRTPKKQKVDGVISLLLKIVFSLGD